MVKNLPTAQETGVRSLGREDPLGNKMANLCFDNTKMNLTALLLWASVVAQMVKNLPAMQEMWVRSLGGEGPLEKGMATHSTILALRIPWTEEPGGLPSRGL